MVLSYKNLRKTLFLNLKKKHLFRVALIHRGPGLIFTAYYGGSSKLMNEHRRKLDSKCLSHLSKCVCRSMHNIALLNMVRKCCFADKKKLLKDLLTMYMLRLYTNIYLT